ncbi:hypothetical protein V6B14_22445 (plasmid) [Sporosarcina psychrophila]
MSTRFSFSNIHTIADYSLISQTMNFNDFNCRLFINQSDYEFQ